MIYSAKGRGARPPVTTERELHVGLMISPQKCLLWLGLHGAVLGEGDLADRPESIQMLTITLLFSGITRKGEDRQKSTFNWYVSNCCLTTNDGLCMRAVVLLSRILQAFSIPASPPPMSCSQWEISQALLKCGHWGWCNQAFRNRERGRNNRWGWGVGGNVGVGWWLGGGIWHISLCWCPGLLAQDTDCWGLGSGCYAWCCFSLCLFGYNSPEQDDVIHRDLWTFLIKRQNHGGEPNVARVWTGQRTIPLLFMGGSIFIAYKLQIL